MTKKVTDIFSKPRSFLGADDITVEEKKKLAAFTQHYGFTLSTFYLRFCQKGFEQWELDGINKCKKQFLDTKEVSEILLQSVPEDGDDGDRGYLYTLAMSDQDGSFYNSLRLANAGLCVRFFDFMNERGMSPATVVKRFTSDQWKPWEFIGIKNLLQNFYDKQ